MRPDTQSDGPANDESRNVLDHLRPRKISLERRKAVVVEAVLGGCMPIGERVPSTHPCRWILAWERGI